jgi:hypothetical protein
MRRIDELERIVVRIGPGNSLVEIGETRYSEIAKCRDLSPIGLHDLIVMMEGEINKNAMMVSMEVEGKRVTLHSAEDAAYRQGGSDLGHPAPAPYGFNKSPKEKFDLLFESGFDLHRDQKFAAALAVWEEACLIDPDNKILNSNIATLRKKLTTA